MSNIDVREIRTKLGITQEELADMLGVSRNTIGNYERGGVIPESKSSILCKLLDKIKTKGEASPAKTEKKVPFYDLDVTASITEIFNDISETPQYYIDYPPLADCTAAFPVYGESMEPDFFAGEVVLVKEIKNVDSMLWGEPYLVITNANCDNLRTLKNVYLSDDRKKFILRATNPRFKGDTFVPLEDVLKIFLVKGKINRRQL
ncbi:helix-turn-helix domain-containing protein [Millionella massiliensis]|uniref:helix-turn-helix domain-containing protein n=1 Tax=Millionella massiliensis TaxID=1871023 RepID=UPI00115FAA5D|nr:helix-turn-helix domain-containing protein [Millionella massiliensis]